MGFGEYDPLSGLGEADTAALFAALEVELPARLVAELQQLTQGNPVFLTLASELLRSAKDREMAIADLAGSTDLQHYLLQEVDTDLRENQRAVLRAASVLLGYPWDRDVLEAILNECQTTPEQESHAL